MLSFNPFFVLAHVLSRINTNIMENVTVTVIANFKIYFNFRLNTLIIVLTKNKGMKIADVILAFHNP